MAFGCFRHVTSLRDVFKVFRQSDPSLFVDFAYCLTYNPKNSLSTFLNFYRKRLVDCHIQVVKAILEPAGMSFR
jgi:hypothetical protein